jgi:hypothetical protein
LAYSMKITFCITRRLIGLRERGTALDLASQ